MNLHKAAGILYHASGFCTGVVSRRVVSNPRRLELKLGIDSAVSFVELSPPTVSPARVSAPHWLACRSQADRSVRVRRGPNPFRERHHTLFKCAAWLTENGAPPSLCSALLTEPGRDVGLTPADVARQIQCGIEHAARQRQNNNSEGGNAA